MNTALYNTVINAVKQASAIKQAADAQFAAVINHPATQTALAFEKQAFSMPALSQQAIDALIGTGLGAVTGGTIGALTADEENRLRNALIGASLLGAAGGIGGYYLGDDVRNLMGLGQEPSVSAIVDNVSDPAQFASDIDTDGFNNVGSLIGGGIGIGAGFGANKLKKLEKFINSLSGRKRTAAGLAAPAALGVIGSLIGGNQ